jgi:hypothetical protein
MRNLALVAALLLIAEPALAAEAKPAASEPPSHRVATAGKASGAASVAPADTYFGPFGMSPLSIRSTIGLLGRQYHYRTISDHDLLRKALMTEDALRKWRAQYPDDPWLAPTFFHLEQLYQAVQTDEARKHATEILRDTVRYYPDTKYGHLSRSRLNAGFPPLVAESPLVATPAPSLVDAPAAAGSAAQAATSPQPASAADSPSPSPPPAAQASAAPHR